MATLEAGRRPSLAVRALALLAAAIPLAACQAGGTVAGSVATPVSAYAAPEQVILDLPVRPGGLNAAEHRAAADFVQAYQVEGYGALEVLSPAGPDAAHASLVVGQVRHVVRRYGVPNAAVVYSTYRSKTPHPQVALRYQRQVQAMVPVSCGQWPSNLAADWENEPYGNFGCATANNLAAMVEDPSDLYGPRATTPRDAERRDTVFENYRTGDVTAAESETDEAVTASDVGE